VAGRSTDFVIERLRPPQWYDLTVTQERSSMTALRKITIALIFFGAGYFGFSSPAVRAQNSPAATQPSASAASNSAPKPVDPNLPAYHPSRPHGPLPDTLDPKQFADPETQNLYALAATEKAVLYQLPCYCRCDKEVGHKSLLDCYVDDHASHCILCKKEAAFAYTETKAGKTAAQIRKEIMDGRWKDVDLSQYDTLPPTQ
jgi:hypothetical protein